MRCKTCHYSLANLTEHRCPECGRAFDPNDPNTFETGRVRKFTFIQCLVISFISTFIGVFVVMAIVTGTLSGQRVEFDVCFWCAAIAAGSSLPILWTGLVVVSRRHDRRQR
jgi:hypothetical protein